MSAINSLVPYIYEEESKEQAPPVIINKITSFNPMTLLFVNPSQRIFCDNPCAFVKELDIAHVKKIQAYKLDLLDAQHADDTHFTNTKGLHIQNGVEQGATYAGWLIGGLCLWKQTPIIAGIMKTVIGSLIGGIAGAGKGYLVAIADKPNTTEAIKNIYNEEIRMAGIITYQSATYMENLIVKHLSAKGAVKKALKDEIKQIQLIREHYYNILQTTVDAASKTEIMKGFIEWLP